MLSMPGFCLEPTGLSQPLPQLTADAIRRIQAGIDMSRAALSHMILHPSSYCRGMRAASPTVSTAAFILIAVKSPEHAVAPAKPPRMRQTHPAPASKHYLGLVPFDALRLNDGPHSILHVDFPLGWMTTSLWICQLRETNACCIVFTWNEPDSAFYALAQQPAIKAGTVDGESSMTLTEIADKKSVRHCKDIGYVT